MSDAPGSIRTRVHSEDVAHLNRLGAIISNTLAQAETYARNHPTKIDGSGGPSWGRWCAALMFWAGGFVRSADTAALARALSTLESGDAAIAPRGAFHWWDIHGINDGHVGLDLDGGGTRVLMASSALTTVWGEHVGTSSVDTYALIVPSTYIGWSRDFIGQQLADTLRPRQSQLSGANGRTLQILALKGGYTGPIDGEPGPNTWKGLQTLLRGDAYAGPVDGVPGPHTFESLQRFARKGGYEGPIDGILGVLTLESLARIGGQE